MSKLRDRIADTARRHTARLGFATSAADSTRQSGIVVIAEVADTDAARTAIDALNGKELDGRTLNVNEARAKTSRSGGGGPRRDSW